MADSYIGLWRVFCFDLCRDPSRAALVIDTIQRVHPMTLETTAMLSALFFMFASIFARVMTIRFILQMKQSVENVQIQKAALLSEQKDISIQLTIAERNKTSIERKMAKREKKLRELKKELKTYIDEQDRRKTKRDEMKKQLIR